MLAAHCLKSVLPSLSSQVLRAKLLCHQLYLALGDLARYAEQTSERADWSKARRWVGMMGRWASRWVGLVVVSMLRPNPHNLPPLTTPPTPHPPIVTTRKRRS